MSSPTFKIEYAFIAAMAVSVLLIFQQYTDYLINDYDYEFSWFAISAKIISNYLTWASLSVMLIKVAKRILAIKITPISILSLLAASLIITLVHRVVSVSAYDLLYYFKSGFLRDFFTNSNQIRLGVGVFSSFIQYCLVLVLIMAILYYAKYIEKQKELNGAQLNALQMQLQPHFLFNTLNSITSLIDIDSKKAQKMLAQLGFLMREMLEHDNKLYISLHDELAYIRTYLDIEHIRFQDRLTIEYALEEGLKMAKIPSLILQPIVENAIKHGISKCPDGGKVAIATNKVIKGDQQFLELSVVNDYRSMNGMANNEGYGIGTRNVQKRLDQLYGVKYSYESHVAHNKYLSRIIIPLEFIS
jgi:sensor histidine kinase YesM